MTGGGDPVPHACPPAQRAGRGGRCARPSAIPALAPPLPRRAGRGDGGVFRAKKGQSTMGFTRHRTSAAPDQTRRDHYQEVTDKIIEALEQGVMPWRRPWNPGLAGVDALPRNATTRRRYHGINVLMLALSPFAWSTGDNRWCSYKQADERSWQVRKGERGTTVFFFKKLVVKEDGGAGDVSGGSGEERFIPMLRAYTVFHASQIDGIPAMTQPAPLEVSWRRPEAVETIVRQQRRGRACRRRVRRSTRLVPIISRCPRTRRLRRRKDTPGRCCTNSDMPRVRSIGSTAT